MAHVGGTNAGYSELSMVESKLQSYVNGVLWTIVAIGFGGFQANIIQF